MSVMAFLESARGSGDGPGSSKCLLGSCQAFLASSSARSATVSIWRRRITVLPARTSASAASATVSIWNRDRNRCSSLGGERSVGTEHLPAFGDVLLAYTTATYEPGTKSYLISEYLASGERFPKYW